MIWMNYYLDVGFCLFLVKAWEGKIQASTAFLIGLTWPYYLYAFLGNVIRKRTGP